MRALIFGGSGTLGTAMIRRLAGEFITIFSRNEHKQKELHRQYGVNCLIGDIKDRKSVFSAFHRDYDMVFHFAAQKHVDTGEEHPEECYKSNILGTQNIIDACRDAEIPLFVFSSTDKATDPINVYGASKLVAERLVLNENKLNRFRQPGDAKKVYSVYRWGNVIGSQGSVIPFFVKNILEEKPVILTHPHMTRFLIKIDEVTDFIMRTYDTLSEAPKVPRLKATYMTQVVYALEEILNKKAHIQYGVIRPGEKLFESLVSAHSNEPKIDSNSQELHFTKEELIAYLKPEVQKFIC